MFTTDFRPLDAVPQETIVTRPLTRVPKNGSLQQQSVVVAQNILVRLDKCSATRLLTSCRRFMVFSLDKHFVHTPLKTILFGFLLVLTLAILPSNERIRQNLF